MTQPHAEGVFMLETIFGETIANAAGRVVPVRLIGEQHVLEDLGTIPSFAEWARLIKPRPWMLRGQPGLNPREARGTRDTVSLGKALVEAGLDHAALAAEAEVWLGGEGNATGLRAAA